MRLETSVPIVTQELDNPSTVKKKKFNEIQWARGLGCRSDYKSLPTVQQGYYVAYRTKQ